MFNKPLSSLSDADIDAMMKDIDRRLKELDEEEAKQKEMLNKPKVQEELTPKIEVNKEYSEKEVVPVNMEDKITGISKEKLKEAKDNKIDSAELEKHLEFDVEYGRKKYDFNTNTIYSEMELLLEKENYENLDMEDKINAIEKALKLYITKIIRCIPGSSDYFRDFEKTLEDLIELMAIHSNNPKNVWDVTNYLVWIIGTLKSPFNIVYSDDLYLKDEPCIDTDRMIIAIHRDTSPVVVFKTIYERLFNIQYLEKNISIKRK